MKALQDKQELRARNKAYKTTLQYCPETCDDVDKSYVNAFVEISRILDLSDDDRKLLVDKLHQLNDNVKDVGTRKLRQSFVDYTLAQQLEDSHEKK